jgi:integrase
MARHVEGPWFRSSKNTWYATVGGKPVSLGVRGESGRQEAVKTWHRLMAGEPKPKSENRAESEPKPTAEPTTVTVRGAADAFLTDAGGRLKPNTMVWYRRAVDGLAEAFGPETLASLTHKRLEVWLAGQRWGDTAKAHALGVLSVFFRWAEREGYCSGNPVARIRKPQAHSRGAESVIPDDAHRRLMAEAPAHFRPLLTLLRETGARPSELARLTAADVDFANSIARLEAHKTAGKTGRPRLVFLSPKAVAVLRTLAKAHPTGPLLRTRLGTAWGKDAIVLAFRRIGKRAGVKATAYGYRHTFATHALAAGVPDAQVAALLGHSGTAMLHRHYSHLTSQAAVLREALAKVR